MHFLASMAIMALTAAVKAMPITPAAPELQRLAEQLRSEGVKEVHTFPSHIIVLS
jgi:hypothetical protein